MTALRYDEEKLNAWSHGFGVLLSLIGFAFLFLANPKDSAYSVSAIVVYSLSVILLFTTSTFYHAVEDKSLKAKLRIADHISIYFLIAGTYTPVSLITLVNGNGWTLFYWVWGIALVGTVLKLFFTGKFEVISLLLYLLMGWLIAFDLSNLIDSMSARGLILLALGGAFYTLGIVFYAFRRIPYNHLIWHFFVLGGAISHWFCIYLEVI